MLSLLTDGDVFAPEPLERQDLLVGAGRILALGRDLAPPRGAPCEHVPLGGLRVIPGLVDLHVHLTGGGGERGFSSRVPPLELGALNRAGVTTAVGLLGTDTVTRDMASLVAATLALREEGLSAYCWTGSGQVMPTRLGRRVLPMKAPQRVARRIRRGRSDHEPSAAERCDRRIQ